MKFFQVPKFIALSLTLLGASFVCAVLGTYVLEAMNVWFYAVSFLCTFGAFIAMLVHYTPE